MDLIHLINHILVGIFGMILSASFCDIYWTKKKRLIMAGSMAVILLIQGIIYFWIDEDMVEYVYPLITHLPLALVLCMLKKQYLWPFASVLTSYLCCQLRRWLALLTTALFAGESTMQNMVELILTLPILLFLLRFTAPSVRSVSHYAVSVQWRFALVPALYYGFDYLTRIYTKLLLEGALVAVEFMPFVCSAAYLVFVVQISEERRIRNRLEQTQGVLNLQVEQAVREIEALRELQKKTSVYRHDLRHHMQYLSNCIANEQFERAQEYMSEICSEIEANSVKTFCENEAANLIFSAFDRRTQDYGIPIKINAGIPQVVPLSESDLCVLLSNALENALHACQRLKEKGLLGTIEVLAYQENEKIFLQFTNSCGSEITFDHGIPVTDNPGHGIGVHSICAIVERYNGIYAFSLKDNKFILQVSF